MTSLQQQAVEMIRYIPDDKVIYIIDILKGLKGLAGNDNLESRITIEELKQYRGIALPVTDEKEELARAREEKYENISRH